MIEPLPVAIVAESLSHFTPSTPMVPLPICLMLSSGQGAIDSTSTFLRELDKSLLDEAGDTVFTAGRRTNNFLGVDTGSPDGFSEPAFRPYPAYDPLKYARQAVRENTRSAGRSFTAGERVRHGKFGEGMVLEVDDKTVTVIFDSVGRKKLAKDIAPIEKL